MFLNFSQAVTETMNKVENTECSAGPVLCSADGEVVAATHFGLSTFHHVLSFLSNNLFHNLSPIFLFK